MPFVLQLNRFLTTILRKFSIFNFSIPSYIETSSIFFCPYHVFSMRKGEATILAFKNCSNFIGLAKYIQFEPCIDLKTKTRPNYTLLQSLQYCLSSFYEWVIPSQHGGPWDTSGNRTTRRPTKFWHSWHPHGWNHTGKFSTHANVLELSTTLYYAWS